MAFEEGEGLQLRSLGPLNDSRFLTRATHTLRLYPSQPFYWNEPDPRLERYVQYLLEAYIATHLYVKYHLDFTQAPRNLHYFVRQIMELKLPEAEEKVLINSVIDNSSAFHQESILMTMVTDHQSRANCKRAVQTILDIRARKVDGERTERVKVIQVWRPPKSVSDAAADYTENLPWGDLTDLEPPVTKALCLTT